MAEMHPVEKLIVNSRIYNLLYRLTALREFLDFSSSLGGKVLEFGCGKGYTSREILRRPGVSLVASDYDEKEVSLAKDNLRATKAKVLRMDATKMPFENGSFDCVIEANTLHHIENYREALRESSRVLKKGGNFFIMDIGRYFLWPFMLLFSWVEPFEGKFTKESLILELEKVGFEIIKHKGKDCFMIHARKK